MKITIISLTLLVIAGAGLTAYMGQEELAAKGTQEPQQPKESADADLLYGIVHQARAELRAARVSAGLASRVPAPHGNGRDSSEGLAERGGNGGEEASAFMPRLARLDQRFANGARLVLQFNPNTQVFEGSVTNTTAGMLPQVRVEVHLDNGVELGPTKRIDVSPGETISVELGTFGNEFYAWVSHPEAGIEEGHGAGGEKGGEGRGERGEGGEGRGEHGEGGEGSGEGSVGGSVSTRPRDPAYRPVFNQLQILRGEIQAFEAELLVAMTK